MRPFEGVRARSRFCQLNKPVGTGFMPVHCVGAQDPYLHSANTKHVVCNDLTFPYPFPFPCPSRLQATFKDCRMMIFEGEKQAFATLGP